MLTRDVRPVRWRLLVPVANADTPEDGNDAERARLERKYARRIADAFSVVRRKVVGATMARSLVTPEQASARLVQAFQPVRIAVRDMLIESTILGARYGYKFNTGELQANEDAIAGAGLTSSWDLLHADALSWVVGGAQFGDGYANETIRGLLSTSDAMVRTAIADWTLSGEPLPALVTRLEGTVFNRTRAELIAVTEVTRAYAEGSRLAWERGGVIKLMRWNTANDELVCPICEPLNQTIAPVTGGTFEARKEDGTLVASARMPPAHPRCRCWLAPVAQDLDSLRDEAEQAKAEAAARRAEAEARRRAEAEAEQKAAKTAPAFPDSIDTLVRVRRLGGSTGAELVEDPLTGARYVMKRGANEAHLRSEFLADELYRAMGTNVPEARLYETAGGPVKLARFIDGQTLGELRSTNKRAYNSAVKKLHLSYGRDAYLGNWDVVGQGFDNVLVDAAGDVWRIDNGGSLMFRAQGGLKRGWGTYVDEFWTLRNPAVNQQTAEVFGSMEYGDIVVGMQRVVKRREVIREILEANGDDELTRLMMARLDSLDDYARIYKTFHADQWVDEYVDGFTKHIAGLRNSGVVQRLPESMRQIKGMSPTVLEDASGERWDALRWSRRGKGKAPTGDELLDILSNKDGILSTDSISSLEQFSGYDGRLDWEALRNRARRGGGLSTSDMRTAMSNAGMSIDDVAAQTGAPSNAGYFKRYLDRFGGGDYTVITDWQEGQRGSSWSGAAQSGKYFYTKQRTLDTRTAFYWQDGLEGAEREYNYFVAKYGKQVYDESLTAMHAWNYEYLRNVKMPHSDMKRGVIRVVRTESRDVLQDYNHLMPGDTGQVVRGAVESASMFDGVVVKGPELTVQDVPFHRAVGNYLFEGQIGSQRTSLYGDGENELVVMLDGLRVHYAGNVYSLQAQAGLTDRLVEERWFSKFKIPK